MYLRRYRRTNKRLMSRIECVCVRTTEWNTILKYIIMKYKEKKIVGIKHVYGNEFAD